LSKIFNPIWMTKMGFSDNNDSLLYKSVHDAVKSKNSGTPELVYLNPEETISSALKTMEENEISHLPVAVGEMPISAAEVIGSVSKEILISNSKNSDGLTVKDFLQPPLELVGVGENISNVVKLFDKSETFLVLDKGRPITVLTKSDVEDFVSESENLLD